MKKGTIKALAVSGGGNHIFRNGDKVTEKQFPENEFSRLVAEGFITPEEIEAEKSVKEIEKLLSEMDGFGDIDVLVAGDERKGVQEAAETRKTEIRQKSQKDAQTSNEKKAEAAKVETLGKIENAKTAGAIKAIIAGNSDEDILKAGAAKLEEFDAAKKLEDEKKAADKKAADEKKAAAKKAADKK